MLFDLHLHTRRYSGDSSIDEFRLIEAARDAGLDGLVVTEHHWQWREDELEELKALSGDDDFVLLAGFEYSSNCGDILIYGLQSEHVSLFTPGGDPEEALERALALGGACIAAHPTRRAIPFGDCIRRMPFHGVEVSSCNLSPNEQKLGRRLAQELKLPATGSSDAHQIENVGRFATEIDAEIASMADLCAAIRSGNFRPADTVNV